VERCADRFRCRDPVAGRDVVHLPVRDHDDASQALARDVRQRVIECLKEPGSIVPSPGLWLSRSDHAEVEIALLGEPILERRQRCRGGVLAIAEALARRFIDYDDRDVALRRALLLDYGGVDESGEQDC
jgi:hypothetical protein